MGDCDMMTPVKMSRRSVGMPMKIRFYIRLVVSFNENRSIRPKPPGVRAAILMLAARMSPLRANKYPIYLTEEHHEYQENHAVCRRCC
jgi:hypothetical protein